MTTTPPESVLVMEVFLTDSNEDIIDKMRAMRQARADRFYTNVICTVSGWADDPRELWDIPEVRAFCGRLVTLGFVSYLDYSTTLDPRASAFVRTGFGAAEVWLTAEGRFGPKLGAQMLADARFAEQVLDDIRRAVVSSNGTADAVLGPIPE